MSQNYKDRIRAAVEKSAKKDLKEIDKLQGTGKKRKKNGKPEKMVERDCLAWMRKMDWEVQIYESKAIYNAAAGRYQANPGVKTGNADCQGIMPSGVSVAVEFKAPGKLSTFLKDTNIPQRDFIIKRIHMNGFAVVVDSVEMLMDIYRQWEILKAKGDEQAKTFLTASLPVRK